MNTECVILAAGLSSRAKTNKMLLKINGKTIIEHCLGAFYDACSKIIMVTGHYREDITRVLDPYSKICFVYNEKYQQGMFSSVKLGVKTVTTKRFFLTPGDYPLLQSSIIHQMLQVNADFITPVYQGIPGHPILLSQLLIPAILSSDADSLQKCLKKVPCKKLIVPDAGIITDVDTLENYEKVKTMMQR